MKSKDPYIHGTFGLVSGFQIFPNQSIDFFGLPAGEMIDISGWIAWLGKS